MQNKAIAIAVIYCLTFLAYAESGTAAKQRTIQDWLEKMSRAGHMQNYVGTFVYSHNSDLTVMKIYHRANNFGELERLISLDGSGREVIRNNDLVTCVLPDKQSIVVEKSKPVRKFPPEFPTQISALKYYTFNLKLQENVAGHLAQKIMVIPNDNFRFGYILWVDVQTGLLLKSHLVDENSKMIEQFLFTNLKYHEDLDEQLFEPQISGKKYTWYEAKKHHVEQPPKKNSWEFENLPPGFKIDLTRNHTMPKSKKSLKHLVVTDGLATISVYIENHTDEKSDLIGGTTMGAVNAYGKHINGYHITSVGEVPLIAVKMISESIRLK